MKIMQTIECKDFNLCVGHASPGETVEHPNSRDKFRTMQLIFIHGSATVTDGTTTDTITSGSWKDMSKFKNSHKLIYSVGDQGITWKVILPKNNTDEYTVEDVADNSVVSAQANSFILVTNGNDVTVNGKKLKDGNVIRLSKNLRVSLNGGVVHKFTVK